MSEFVSLVTVSWKCIAHWEGGGRGKERGRRKVKGEREGMGEGRSGREGVKSRIFNNLPLL